MILGLSDHDMATSHAFQVMIEEQLIPCLHLDRYVYNTWNEYSKLGLYFIPKDPSIHLPLLMIYVLKSFS